jgi:Flp pilus assembly CpaF family ATPase
VTSQEILDLLAASERDLNAAPAANLRARGVRLRRLVKESLRMRPDRILG